MTNRTSFPTHISHPFSPSLYSPSHTSGVVLAPELLRAAASTRRTNLISSADLAQSPPISSNLTIFPKSYGTFTTLQSSRVRLRQATNSGSEEPALLFVCVRLRLANVSCRSDSWNAHRTACRLVPVWYVSCRLELGLIVSCRLELGLSVACRIQRALGVAFRRIQRLAGLEARPHNHRIGWQAYRGQKGQEPHCSLL